jgi:hypothetical protein
MLGLSITFWLNSRNFAETFKSNPSSFFETNFVSSVLKRPKGAKIVQFAEQKQTRSTEQIKFTINQRFSYYEDFFNSGHITKLSEPLTDTEFTNRLNAMVERLKTKIDTSPRTGLQTQIV